MFWIKVFYYYKKETAILEAQILYFIYSYALFAFLDSKEVKNENLQ